MSSDMSSSPSAARSFFRIVCTGGPCGGKTSALASIAGALKAEGITVYGEQKEESRLEM